ncbi:hypothetical protein BDW02DRAFT_458129, partial [Decorospora gaudefroyi]
MVRSADAEDRGQSFETQSVRRRMWTDWNCDDEMQTLEAKSKGEEDADGGCWLWRAPSAAEAFLMIYMRPSSTVSIS